MNAKLSADSADSVEVQKDTLAPSRSTRREGGPQVISACLSSSPREI